MGQAFSTVVGWIWSKLSTTPSPSSPHDQFDVDIHSSIEGYTHDPELGVETHDPELGVETHDEANNPVDQCGYELGASSKEIRWKGHYNSSHKILLVGEGDFSFSASLALAFGDASNLVATSLDSLEFLGRNYSKAMRNILELTRRGCKVMNGIDSTRMAKQSSLNTLKFDRIVFNFPHAGFFDPYEPRHMQISRHQALVKGFLGNAKKMIKEDGEVHITQKTTSFFREWNIKKLASLEGLRLVGEAPFDFQDYRGYRTKFGYGGDENFGCNPCKTYKFQLA